MERYFSTRLALEIRDIAVVVFWRETSEKHQSIPIACFGTDFARAFVLFLFCLNLGPFGPFEPLQDWEGQLDPS